MKDVRFNYDYVRRLSRKELEKLTLKELDNYVLGVVGLIYGMVPVSEDTREAYIEALVTENLDRVYRAPKNQDLY